MMRVGEHGDIERYLARKAQQQTAFRRHGWRVLWPTPKQSAVFSDRGMAKPATRGEAADQIAAIKREEGWDDAD